MNKKALKTLETLLVVVAIVSSVVNYSATSNRASCFNHYCVGYDTHNSASYTVSTGV